MDWTVAGGHTLAERDVTCGIADWGMGMIVTTMIVTTKFGDDVA
jgi:hypothetical protein